MKNLEALIRRVEMFEKLAVYSDRSSFLKSLAADSLDSKTKNTLQQMANLLQQAGVTDEDVWDPINSALSFGHVNLGSIRQAVTSAAVRMTNADISEKLYQLAQQLISLPPGQSPVAPAQEDQVVEELVVTTPKPVQYPTIDKEQQRALGKILTIEGLGLPLDADGKLGPKTKAALQALRKRFNLSSYTDAEALAFAKMLVQETEKYR